MSELRKKNARQLALAALGACLLAARGASAQSGTGALTSQNAVEIAIKNNPNLHIALLQETQARYAVRAEEALYDPVFDASANYSHNRNPSPNGDGTIVTTTNT